MGDKPWAENAVEIVESYQETYPSGKRNYEQIHFGPVREARFIYVPDSVVPDEYIHEVRCKMHDRLMRSVIDMVNKAIEQGRLVGVAIRKN